MCIKFTKYLLQAYTLNKKRIKNEYWQVFITDRNIIEYTINYNVI